MKIIKLIREVQRNPFEGAGQPEVLKHDLFGCGSRRIDQEHRLVYELRLRSLDIVLFERFIIAAIADCGNLSVILNLYS